MNEYGPTCGGPPGAQATCGGGSSFCYASDGSGTGSSPICASGGFTYRGTPRCLIKPAFTPHLEFQELAKVIHALLSSLSRSANRARMTMNVKAEIRVRTPAAMIMGRVVMQTTERQREQRPLVIQVCPRSFDSVAYIHHELITSALVGPYATQVRDGSA